MKLSKTAKNMIWVILASSAVFIAIAACVLFYYSFNLAAFVIGVLMSTALNVIKVLMLENAVDTAVKLEQKAAGAYLSTQYLIRFIMTGVVLAAAAIAPFINIWGAAVGILTLQIAAYAMKFFIHDEVKETDGEAETLPDEEETAAALDKEIFGEVADEPDDKEPEEEVSGPADEEKPDEEIVTAADEEKKRLRKKPAGQSAERRMKKKPARHKR